MPLLIDDESAGSWKDFRRFKAMDEIGDGWHVDSNPSFEAAMEYPHCPEKVSVIETCVVKYLMLFKLSADELVWLCGDCVFRCNTHYEDRIL